MTLIVIPFAFSAGWLCCALWCEALGWRRRDE